jgi:hypothetical protein
MSDNSNNPVTTEELESAFGGARRDLYTRIRGSGLTLDQVKAAVAGTDNASHQLDPKISVAGITATDLKDLANGGPTR